MSATTAVCHRVVVVAPEAGWLTIVSPCDGEARGALGRAWQEATLAAVRAAGMAPMPCQVRLVATACPVSIAVVGPGIRHAEDVRAVFHSVMAGLEQAGVLPSWRQRLVTGSTLILGTPADSGHGFLVVEMTEVPDVR